MDNIAIGIDLGTCSTGAAVAIGDRIEPVNLSGVQFSPTPSMPTIVVVEASGNMIVGPRAERQRANSRSIFEFKLEMERSPGRWVETGGAPRLIPWVDVVKAILEHVKGAAERDYNNGNPIEHAVLTVPALYAKGGTAWNLMEEAGRRAGFRRIEIIREPHAAALYYDHLLTRAGRAPSKDGDQVLIYDLGGGTFDPALIKRSRDAYPIERAGSGAACGGTFFDARLREDFDRKCPGSAPVPPRRNPDGSVPETERAVSARFFRDSDDIRRFLLNCKHSFSDLAQKEFHGDAPPLEMESYSLSRTEFDGLIAKLLDDTIKCCESLLQRAGVSWRDLAAVVLVGGSCALLAVQSKLASAMVDSGGDPKRIVWQRIPGTDILIDPGTAVCRGAASYAISLRPSAPAVVSPQVAGEQHTPQTLEDRIVAELANIIREELR
jgi:molecular chaperone DnaK (HSP70)